MQPIGFWTLVIALLGIIVASRVLTGWAWRSRVYGPRVAGRLRDAPGTRSLWRGFARRMPRTSRWVAARVDPRVFPGLPLTLMLLLAVYLVMLGGGLVEDLLEDNELHALDERINADLGVLRNERFVTLFGGITALGNTETLTAVTLVTVGFLWAHHRSVFIPGLLIAIIGSQLVTWAGKFLIDRDRPDFLTFAEAASPSFPSAHATGAMAVYGFIAYAIARDLDTASKRFELAYWAAVLIGLVAASRMILSVHYASDIAAGLVVGGFWLLVGFAVTEMLRHRLRAESLAD